jgi:hypothetical protein
MSLLLIMLATESQARACWCIPPMVDKAFETSASIFVGEVVQISGPREVQTESGVEQLYPVKFFVWERWKGAKAFEVEVLSPQKQRSCFDRPPMQIGETYLVFADPMTVEGSPRIRGIIKPCSRTTLFVGSGSEPVVGLDAVATILELDKVAKRAPQRTPALGRQEIGRARCLFC